MIRKLVGKAFVTLSLLSFFSFPGMAEDLDIVSISPSTRKPLEAGSTVSFEIVVDYKIEAADFRRVRLEILRGGDGERKEVLSRWVQLLPKGKDTFTMNRTVLIPETGRITVEAVIPADDSRDKVFAFQKKEFEVVDPSGKKVKPRVNAGDSIVITSLSPGPELPLVIGESVNFTAKISYDLRSGRSGRIVWFLTSAGESQAILASEVVAGGKGTLDLSKSVQMRFGLGTQPDMFVFLMADGYVRSRAADLERYRLTQSPSNASANPPDAPPQITVNVAAPQVDRIRIVPISPPPDKSLRVGDTVDFEIRLDYDLDSTDLAELSVRFGDASRFLAQDDRVVSKGSGSATIKRRIVIPPGTEGAFGVRVGFSPPATATDTQRYTIISK
jgi:hypothetical protein